MYSRYISDTTSERPFRCIVQAALAAFHDGTVRRQPASAVFVFA
jgi:hypothetical protein